MTDVSAVSITDGLQDALDKTVSVLPKLVLFLVILIAGWILSRVISNLVDRLLEKVGYNKAVQKSGLQRWLGEQKASTLTARLAYYALLLFTLQLAFGVFGSNPVSNLIDGVVRWLPTAFIAVIIIVVAASIARGVRDIIEGALGRLSYGRLLASIVQVFIIALGVMAALNQMGIAVSITQPVLIAVLATVGGILVVGVGGGLVMPMRNRWERILLRAERDTSTMITGDHGGSTAPASDQGHTGAGSIIPEPDMAPKPTVKSRNSAKSKPAATPKPVMTSEAGNDIS